MTFSLSDDEQNGVSIAVNTILKIAYGIGDSEDWSAVADEWWKERRERIADNPEDVVNDALETLISERTRAQMPEIGIYVLPTEEDLPPRAAFVIEVAPGMTAAVGGASYTDGAWRYPDGREVEEGLADAITEHAESLGVEWDH